MSYTVSASEKLRKSGADFETKSLLYLMSFYANDIEPYYFVVDFFNDLTGMDKLSTKLIDLQAKSKSNSSAKEIGRELVTLYKNFLTEFPFEKYILFLGGIPTSFCINNNTEFYFSDIDVKNQQSVMLGLKEEIKRKVYTKNEPYSEDLLVKFLNEVLFVVNSRTEKEYIREIIRTDNIEIIDENKLIAIFNEIRDKQSSKKNCNDIEGITIQDPCNALNFGRHLRADEIRLLVINRLLINNPFDAKPPTSFLLEVLKDMPAEKIDDEIENCKMTISKMLFNKNSSDVFWCVFENIDTVVRRLPKESSLNEIYLQLDKEIIKSCFFLDIISLKYLIAAVKEGIYGNKKNYVR
ncbi:MAG: hypothetical protein PUI38_07855 [Candidatus Treponema excrementipullorum]|nr:hypothetical protein [Candidatus Treponema excrementipullorum]